jgi:hypothetical protein
LQIRGTTYWYLKVYCEQEVADGGWTVSNCPEHFHLAISLSCKICDLTAIQAIHRAFIIDQSIR